jgi:hypothetical protein
MPDSQTFLFSCGSKRTSFVPYIAEPILVTNCNLEDKHNPPNIELGHVLHTIDFVANALISLIALGARFLNVTP